MGRNTQHAKVYQAQIEDMIERQVARKLTQTEVDNYRGPIHYISHHDVLKPDSKSTPVKIVFNSSASYIGQVLNEYWAKGPDLLNNLLGILVRFRENEIGFIGDMKKMYHTVKTRTIEEGDIGVCGIAVLANFSCGISVILILNCGIAVFSKPAGCVFFTLWSTIFGTKTYPSLFNEHF